MTGRISSITLITFAMVLSIITVVTCQFVKIKNGPWIGLSGLGMRTWYKGECTLDFWETYSDGDEEPNLEDDAGLTARVFGIFAALFGFIIFVFSIVSIFVYPRWMWFTISISTIVNCLFQGLTFTIYESEACVDSFYGYDSYYYPPYYYNDDWYQFGEDCGYSYGYDTNGNSNNDNSNEHVDAYEENSNQRQLQPSDVTDIPSLSPIVSNSTLTSTPSKSPSSLAPTLSTTSITTSMPTYCLRFKPNYDLVYVLKSGGGCELAAGAGTAIAAMSLWLLCGIIMFFRKPTGMVLIDCKKPCTTCCYSSRNAMMGTAIIGQSSVSNSANHEIGSTANDYRKVVKEEVGADGSKYTVTSFEPIYKEKTTVEEIVLNDGSKIIKTTKETFEQKV